MDLSFDVKWYENVHVDLKSDVNLKDSKRPQQLLFNEINK